MSQVLSEDDYIDMKPDFCASILHNLFENGREETECSEELHMKFYKNDFIKSNTLYRIAHSPYYKGYLMLIMPVLGILIIMIGVHFMKSLYCTIIVMALCTTQLLCSLTRIDRRLLRSLYTSFEWTQFMLMVGVFVVFCGMSTGQREPGFLVWSAEATYSYIQFLAMTVPIAIMLTNLDAVPLYPFVVKTSMLCCVLMLLGKVIGTDLKLYLTDKAAYNDPTQRTMCIGSWICTNAKGVTNLVAGQLTFFILRHLFILFQAWWKKDVWKPLTTIGIPLYIHPHFQRDMDTTSNVNRPDIGAHFTTAADSAPAAHACTSSSKVNKKIGLTSEITTHLESNNNNNNNHMPDTSDSTTSVTMPHTSTTMTTGTTTSRRTTVTNDKAFVVCATFDTSHVQPQNRNSTNQISTTLTIDIPSTPNEVMDSRRCSTDGEVFMRGVTSSSSPSMRERPLDLSAARKNFIDSVCTHNRRQSMRIVNVSLPRRASHATSSDCENSRRTTHTPSTIISPSPITVCISPSPTTVSVVPSPIEEEHKTFQLVTFPQTTQICENTDVNSPSHEHVTPSMLSSAAATVDNAPEPSANRSQCHLVKVVPGTEPPTGDHLFRRIDHRERQPTLLTTLPWHIVPCDSIPQSQSTSAACAPPAVASEFAFEIGSYATHLTVNAVNAKTGRDAEFQRWMFPTQFRPLNTFQCVRRFVRRQRHALTVYYMPISVLNILLLYAIVLVSAHQPPDMGFAAGWIVHGCFTAVLFVVPLGLIGASVMDRHILHYLCTSKFEVWMFLYQITFVLVMQCMMSIAFLQACALIVWYTCNLQMLFLDAAVWYSYRVKRAIIMLAIALTVILVAIDSQSHAFGHISTACFITCSGLHTSSVFTMCLVMMYGCRCLTNLLRFPTACIILKLPLLYQSASTRKETRTHVTPMQST